ncbi:phosphatase PAP2 family protein [Adlercreutzia murintestinalis]|uniref:phosphatase PAP2 family protein n=1 Tax=Adlercreutzia murintestinalis TaxID=2941325 RepID=UPI0020419ACC|nr:phosphatase PAP2 family protein [Adlercreutzia murintestinalis]
MLIAANRALTVVGYVAYPLLLVLLALFGRSLLLRCIVVPAVGFALCSIVRTTINAPRPYEAPGAPAPRIPKDTRGHSFPSRHTFCMVTIACTWLEWAVATSGAAWWAAVVGGALVAASIAMAIMRVVGGVHFARDVVAGAALALVVCAVGYQAIPWTLLPI